MVHDSSDGEDETDKNADKGGKVLSKALPQEQAMIRFKYRGTQHPLMLKNDICYWSGLCVYNEPVSLLSS